MLLNNINWFLYLVNQGSKLQIYDLSSPIILTIELFKNRKKWKLSNYSKQKKWKEIWALDVFVGKLTKLQVQFDKPIA